MTDLPEAVVLHASAIALAGRGLLITGRSGSGKSGLALELISRGATLVADDRTVATPRPGGLLWLSAPPAISGRIEARGVGLLAQPATEAPATFVVCLDHTETSRLPAARETVIAGTSLPLLHAVESTAFPAMLLACLSGERIVP